MAAAEPVDLDGRADPEEQEEEEEEEGTTDAAGDLALLRGQVTELEALVHRLLDETAAMRELTQRPTATASDPAPVAPTRVAPTPVRPLDRRSLLRVAGVGAAATAVTATGLATAPPAAAANGQAITAGATNQATNPTYLQDTSTGIKNQHILYVTDASTVTATSTAAAVGGEAHNDTVTVGVAGSTTNPNSYGVIGRLVGLSAGTGAAVWGSGGFGGTGVSATTNAGGDVAGLEASGGVGARVDGSRANLHLVPGGPAAPERTDITPGYVLVDKNFDLWLSLGFHGWRKLAGPSTAGALHVLDSTTRVYDSRAGTQPPNGTKTKFQTGNERVIDAKVGGSAPAGARAVMINATATNTNPGGFFAFFKNGIVWPKNSSLSWGVAGTTVSTTTVVAVDGASNFKARMEGAGGADLLIDVIGYYR